MAIDPNVLAFFRQAEDDLRVRIGLAAGDDSKDSLITLGLGYTLELVETYLDRKLLHLDEDEYVGPGLHGRFLVRRWPIDLDTVMVSGPQTAIHTPMNVRVNHEAGIVRFSGAVEGDTLHYSGGYVELPPALAWAIMAAFDAVWSATPGMGATAGGGFVQGSGEIKKISVVGVGSIDYDVGVTATASSSESGGSAPWSIFPESVMAILDRYRRESVVGAG